MEQIVKKRIIDISKDIIDAVAKKDNVRLKVISNYTIHNSSIFQDEDSISIATITYSLSNIIERYKFTETKQWAEFHNNIITCLKDARKELIKDNLGAYKNILKDIFKVIENFDHKLAIYVQEVIERSKIKKGSAILAHGISLGRVAEILGVSSWDLMDYIGKTNVFETKKSPSVKQRLNLTRKLFGLI